MSSLDKEVYALIDQSPTTSAAVHDLRSSGWKIGYSNGRAWSTHVDFAHKRIEISGRFANREYFDTGTVAAELADAAGKARYGPVLSKVSTDGMVRENWVAAKIDHLRNQDAEGVLSQAETRHEIIQNGGPDILPPINGPIHNGPTYEVVDDNHVINDPTGHVDAQMLNALNPDGVPFYQNPTHMHQHYLSLDMLDRNTTAHVDIFDRYANGEISRDEARRNVAALNDSISELSDFPTSHQNGPGQQRARDSPDDRSAADDSRTLHGRRDRRHLLHVAARGRGGRILSRIRGEW
ncbi:hypothetical protein [Nocardia sp. alder85J]|uniref:hypothetical protein n=1 Tax=Nocardia sp. alder85J TaxID=2862949 RepID=UPI001CD1F688|nr:hypothetical protein [Nocardia sp. alder85J]MCX4096158.1 hypothetical protein [Nocardia sp. alder85J]